MGVPGLGSKDGIIQIVGAGLPRPPIAGGETPPLQITITTDSNTTQNTSALFQKFSQLEPYAWQFPWMQQLIKQGQSAVGTNQEILWQKVALKMELFLRLHAMSKSIYQDLHGQYNQARSRALDEVNDNSLKLPDFNLFKIADPQLKEAMSKAVRGDVNRLLDLQKSYAVLRFMHQAEAQPSDLLQALSPNDSSIYAPDAANPKWFLELMNTLPQDLMRGREVIDTIDHQLIIAAQTTPTKSELMEVVQILINTPENLDYQAVQHYGEALRKYLALTLYEQTDVQFKYESTQAFATRQQSANGLKQLRGQLENIASQFLGIETNELNVVAYRSWNQAEREYLHQPVDHYLNNLNFYLQEGLKNQGDTSLAHLKGKILREEHHGQYSIQKITVAEAQQLIEQVKAILQHIKYVQKINLAYQQLANKEADLADMGKMDSYYTDDRSLLHDVQGRGKDSEAVVPRIEKMRERLAKGWQLLEAKNYPDFDRAFIKFSKANYALHKQYVDIKQWENYKSFAINVGVLLAAGYLSPLAAGRLVQMGSWLGRTAMATPVLGEELSLAMGAAQGLAELPALQSLGRGASYLFTTADNTSVGFGLANAASFHYLDKGMHWALNATDVEHSLAFNPYLSFEQNAAHEAYDITMFNPMLRFIHASKLAGLALLPQKWMQAEAPSLTRVMQHPERLYPAEPLTFSEYGQTYLDLARGLGLYARDTALWGSKHAALFTGEYVGFNVWWGASGLVGDSVLKVATGETITFNGWANGISNQLSPENLTNVAEHNFATLFGLQVGGAGARATTRYINKKLTK